MVIINNNNDRYVGLPLAKENAPVEHLTLSPGANDLTPEQWALAQKTSKHVAVLLSEGVLSVERVTAGPAKNTDLPAASLKELAPKDAATLVGRTTDADLLQRWLKTEERKDVQRALNKQLDSLDFTAKEEPKK